MHSQAFHCSSLSVTDIDSDTLFVQAPAQPDLASFNSLESSATPPWLANGMAMQHQLSELPDAPAVPHHRQVRTVGTVAELSRQPYPSPRIASSTAAMADPILGGELVIRVIDAQVRADHLCSQLARCPDSIGLCKACGISCAEFSCLCLVPI